VYSPAVCGNGDKAVRIKAGNSHILILTESHKVWGVGNNEQYQLVPQGQCRYDTAVELIVTDTNLHDNNCCDAFTGIYNELECPIIPKCDRECNQITCIKDSLCDILLGYFNICGVVVSPPGCPGIFSVPIYGDISYVGFLCVDSNGCVSGSVTYTITRIYIKCGCLLGKFSFNEMDENTQKCHVIDINISSTTELLIFESDLCHAKVSPCEDETPPITGTSPINGKCGSCVTVDIKLPENLDIPIVNYDNKCKTILLELKECKSSLTILCDGVFSDLNSEHTTDFDLDFDVPLDCCDSYNPPKHKIDLPQPCWNNIYAGGDISVLVDNCNRLYVFGSLHNVRSNKDLLRRSCLEDILNKVNASITFPADQLNCSTNPIRDGKCKCPKCRDKPFKTDLNKFGIHISFPNGCNQECPTKTVNVCDFLQTLKRCNEQESCEPTCEPCDGYIYLNIEGECGCPCGSPTSSPIGSVTLFNKKSICKLVSQGSPDFVRVEANVNTIVEFDLNKYCIDTSDFSLEKIIKLDFCVDGPNVNLYLDISNPGGVRFTADGKKCNVEFTVNASTQSHQFLLNFGSILDPVELTNLKYALSLDCHYPCPKFKNPFDTKITSTYLKGGDRIRFVTSNPKNIRQAITADIPTVFRLNRRILDVGVGQNNLSVLVGGLACPNDILVIGVNCHGELGIGTNESTVCWKQVDRCIFDCQVNSIFSSRFVTFYITQSRNVYASGQWKCFVNSTSPAPIKTICQSWKIKQMAISINHIIFLGSDGCIFGLGDNNLGELGLCNLDCIIKPTPLVFFYRLNSCVAKQLRDNLAHPLEVNYGKRYDPNYGSCYCGNCGPNFCQYDKPVVKCGPCRIYPPNDCEPYKYYRYTNKKYIPNGRVCASKIGKKQ
jgi:hypothetical protein